MSFILAGLIVWEFHKLKELDEVMVRFLESNAEIFTTINGNAAVQREHITRTEALETVVTKHAAALDVHAHALQIYGPALTFSTKNISANVRDLENFGG